MLAREGGCGVEKGDIVRHQGRRHALRGFTPMSLPDRQAELDDVLTGEWVTVPFGQVEPLGRDEGRVAELLARGSDRPL
jgi:hypothetical protein